MSICIFFGYFQWLEQIIKKKKKNFGAVTWVGLLPKQYCRENILYFDRGDYIAGVYCNVVGLNSLSCIAIEKEGCLVGEVVSQYTWCIVT